MGIKANMSVTTQFAQGIKGKIMAEISSRLLNDSSYRDELQNAVQERWDNSDYMKNIRSIVEDTNARLKAAINSKITHDSPLLNMIVTTLYAQSKLDSQIYFILATNELYKTHKRQPYSLDIADKEWLTGKKFIDIDNPGSDPIKLGSLISTQPINEPDERMIAKFLEQTFGSTEFIFRFLIRQSDAHYPLDGHFNQLINPSVLKRNDISPELYLMEYKQATVKGSNADSDIAALQDLDTKLFKYFSTVAPSEMKALASQKMKDLFNYLERLNSQKNSNISTITFYNLELQIDKSIQAQVADFHNSINDIELYFMVPMLYVRRRFADNPRVPSPEGVIDFADYRNFGKYISHYYNRNLSKYASQIGGSYPGPIADSYGRLTYHGLSFMARRGYK